VEVGRVTSFAAIALFPWGLLLAVGTAYLLAVAALVVAGRRGEARALAGFIPDCIVLVKRLATDPATPRHQRALLLLLAVYLASPIDIVPDFIPVAGQLDDAVLVGAALHLVLRSRGEAAIRAAWPGPESSLRLILRAAGAG
jgi:uncharacterized membrane protein YkvA (DUF1232 family)